MSEKKFLGNTKEVVSQRDVAKKQPSFCSDLSDMYSFLEVVSLHPPPPFFLENRECGATLSVSKVASKSHWKTSKNFDKINKQGFR